MTQSNLILNAQELDSVERIIAVFEPCRAELSNHLKKIYMDHIFENSHELHPSRLASYGAEETDSLIAFLKDRDTVRTGQLGAERAGAGLGFASVAGIRAFLNQFVLQKMPGALAAHLPTTLKLIDVYFTNYLQGYLDEFKKQLLIQQKELRQALSNTLTE
jgi:hypothetical protein